MRENKLSVNHNINIKSSLDWVRGSFYIFRASPIQFICLSLIVMVCSALSIASSVLSGTLPILAKLSSVMPLILAFLSPLFTAQFARLALKVENGEYIKLNSILSGIFSNPLIIMLGLLNMLFMLLASVSLYFNLNFIYLALGVVFALFMWLSPIICLNNIPLQEALQLSFKASCSNALTLLCYIFILVGLFILTIPTFGLGLFILVPIINIAPYMIYKDIIVPAN